MEKILYSACLEGDVETLEALMRQDKLLLARVSLFSCFNQTPLHLASMLGHFKFSESLLSYKPDFASRLDSQGCSPLHLASANGYASIVELLLQHDQKMCQVCDEDGRTPLHLAVMNGQHESVGELIKVDPELYDQDRRVLHLGVMYNRLNILVLLLESNAQNLANIKDDKGNTILHSATTLRRMQIIKYLMLNTSDKVLMDVNAVNKSGLTTLNIIEQMPKDAKTMEIKELLISAGTLRAEEIEHATMTSLLNPGVGGVGVADQKIMNYSKNFSILPRKREKKDKNLLVAASVIAAMAYQAALSPPGGIDNSVDATEDFASISALLSVLDYTYLFWICNTIAFMAALSVIFLYVSGASLHQRFLVWLIQLGMWITLSAMASAYILAVKATITPHGFDIQQSALPTGIIASVALILLFILVLVFRSLGCIMRIIFGMIKRAIKKQKKNTSEEEASASFKISNTNIV